MMMTAQVSLHATLSHLHASQQAPYVSRKKKELLCLVSMAFFVKDDLGFQLN